MGGVRGGPAWRWGGQRGVGGRCGRAAARWGSIGGVSGQRGVGGEVLGREGGVVGRGAGRRRWWFGERGADGHGKQREDPGLARSRPLVRAGGRGRVGESGGEIGTDGAASTCSGRTRVAGTRCPPAPASRPMSPRPAECGRERAAECGHETSRRGHEISAECGREILAECEREISAECEREISAECGPAAIIRRRRGSAQVRGSAARRAHVRCSPGSRGIRRGRSRRRSRGRGCSCRRRAGSTRG